MYNFTKVNFDINISKNDTNKNNLHNEWRLYNASNCNNFFDKNLSTNDWAIIFFFI
jgi:hypothetical protein